MDDRVLVTVSDTLPTAFEVGVIRGNVQPGCTVGIVGAGPVGLAAGLMSTLFSPRSIVFFDLDASRLALAKNIIGPIANTINTGGENRQIPIRELAQTHFGEIDGFDVVMEAAGIPATWNMCQQLVGKGGSIVNIGVHGTKVDLAINELWMKGISESTSSVPQFCFFLHPKRGTFADRRYAAISMALVSTHTIPRLLDLLSAGRLDTAGLMVTHGQYSFFLFFPGEASADFAAEFRFSEIEKAYDVFGNAGKTGAMKISITFD